MSQFTWLDWAIVLVYVVGAGAAGLMGRRYVKTVEDFIVAGRGLNPYLAIATLAGTEMGLVTVVYMAEQGYKNGFSAFVIGLIAGLGMGILGLTGFLIKGFRASGAMTIAEYYEMRYSKGVRLMGGIVIATAGILNMGVFLKAGALFLTQVTGLPEVVSVGGIQVPILNLVMTILLVVVLLYTVVGGMISVVFTDYIQFIVLSLGFILATIVITAKLGLGSIAQAVVEYKGIDGLSPFVNPNYGWAYVIWQILLFTTASATWQTAAMRVSATRSPEVAQRVYRWTSLVWIGRAILPMFWGVAALAYFGTRMEGVTEGSLKAMPAMLGQFIPVGILGLLTAGMLAAFMSTHDSYLLAWSSVITQDIIAPLRKRELSTRARIAITRVLIVLIGIFLLIWGLWYQLPGTMWDYLALTGTMYLSGTLAMLTCGLYWKKANRSGAYTAIALGVILPVSQLFLLDKVNAFLKVSLGFELSPGLAGMSAYIVAMLGMIIGSLLGHAFGRKEGR
ncbi:MAG TPA: sodium:solute symporter family protein [Candidatus Latescibacteria bacterium]|nr:sodium:solute symporter family protein [Candidatus Latescibacterota bacterium]